MTNKSKAKGTTAEGAVVAWLQTHGFPYAERRALSGNKDRGDIAGVPGVVTSVKNCARLELAAWMDEAGVQAFNANVEIYAVWHKRRGRGSAGDWFVTMPGHVFTELVK